MDLSNIHGETKVMQSYLLFQAERFVDRKLDKAEELLKKKEVKAKKWYNNFVDDGQYRATESHVFLASFVAGMALGMMCGK